MTLKKRRTKEQILKETFANAKVGADLLPLLRYASHKQFVSTPLIQTTDFMCPLEAVLDGHGVFTNVRAVLGIPTGEDFPETVRNALEEFISAADFPETHYHQLRSAILNKLGIEVATEAQNVG